MTEPVAGTTPVRRTVRVAVALVAGQAALCAVIGWVTLGPSPGGEHPAPRRGVDVLAGPPMTVPPGLPVTSASAAAGSPSVTHRTRTRTARAVPPSVRPTPSAATEAPPVPRGVDDPPPPTSPPAPPPVVPISLLPPFPEPPPLPTSEAPDTDPTGPPASEAPAEVGRPCDDEGEEARTRDGTPVRCLPDRDDVLRWQII